MRVNRHPICYGSGSLVGYWLRVRYSPNMRKHVGFDESIGTDFAVAGLGTFITLCLNV